MLTTLSMQKSGRLNVLRSVLKPGNGKGASRSFCWKGPKLPPRAAERGVEQRKQVVVISGIIPGGMLAAHCLRVADRQLQLWVLPIQPFMITHC
jgi:hypothetical protein